MDPSEIVAAGYDQLAAGWDEWACEVSPDVRFEHAQQLALHLVPGATVVDLGCGTGRPVGSTLSEAFDYFGVDVAPEMVRLASENCPSGRFVTSDMSDLVFPDASVAGVVAFYSIIHVPRDRHAAIFSDVFRWLEPGGWFVATLGTTAQEAGVDPSWLGAGPMYWSGWDADSNLTLLWEAGFLVRSAEVVEQVEPGDDPVEFQWVRCQKPYS